MTDALDTLARALRQGRRATRTTTSSRTTTTAKLCKRRADGAGASRRAVRRSTRGSRSAREEQPRREARRRVRARRRRELLRPEWTPFEIKKAATTTSSAKKQIQAQNDAIEKLRKTGRGQVHRARSVRGAELSMAAKVRFGDIQYDFGQKIEADPGAEDHRRATPMSSRRSSRSAMQAPAEVPRGGQGQWVGGRRPREEGRHLQPSGASTRSENLGREFPDEFKALRQELIQGTDAP